MLLERVTECHGGRSTADRSEVRRMAEQVGYRLEISTAPGTLIGHPVRHHSSRELPEGPGLVAKLLLSCCGTFKRDWSWRARLRRRPHLLRGPRVLAARVRAEGEDG